MDQQTIEQAAFELDLYGFTVLPSVIPASEALRLAEVLDDADARIGIEYVYDGAYAACPAPRPWTTASWRWWTMRSRWRWSSESWGPNSCSAA
jgi:hypothetical protein